MINDSKILKLEEAIKEGSKNHGTISIVIIKNGKREYIVYKNGIKEETPNIYDYEIGSITKTLTGSLFLNVLEKMNMDFENYFISNTKLLSKDVLTHSSGLPNYHNYPTMIVKGITGNPFYNIKKEKLFNFVKEKEFSKGKFSYSNLGYSIIGHETARLSKTDYQSLMLDYLKSEFNMDNTYFANGSGTFKKYWKLKYNDGYSPAGGLVSNIKDMGNYLEVTLKNEKQFINKSLKILKKIDGKNDFYKNLGSGMDSVATSWMYDEKNNYYWHNGGTTYFNSYMAFNLKKEYGVVVLSSSNYKNSIPATIIGIKLMEELRSN